MDVSNTTGIVGGIAGVAASAVGAVFWYLCKDARKQAESAKHAATAAKDAAKADITALREQAKADINLLREEHAAYKLHVAERYVTQDALTKAVTGVEKALDRLMATIEKNAAEQREAFAEIHRRIDSKVDK